jgi:hypothetical protein
MNAKISVDSAFQAVLTAEAMANGGFSGLARKLANNNFQIQQQNLNLLNGALQYEGLRDVFLSGGWKPAATEAAAIAEMGPFYYKRVGTAATIIKKPPEWTWRRGIEIRSDNPTFSEEANDLIQNMQLINKMSRSDKLSRIGRYGLLLKVHADIIPGAPGLMAWGSPVSPSTPIVDFKPIMEAQVAQVFTGVAGEIMYKIDFNPPGSKLGDSAKTVTVHSSRVIHIADNQDESKFYGTPTIMPIINELDDLLKVSASSGEGFWRYRGTFVLQQAMDKEGHPVGFATDGEQDALMDAFRDYFYGLYSTMILSNVEPKQIADEPVEPSAWQDAIYQRIAVGIDWPKRILVGSETGERASTEDLKQWGAKIESRQKLHAEPEIARPTIDSLILSGQLPDPGPAGYEVHWPTVFTETSSDAAAIGKDMASVNKELAAATGEAAFSIDEIRIRMGFPALDV